MKVPISGVEVCVLAPALSSALRGRLGETLRRLIVLIGLEGVGKSTLVRALVRSASSAAQIDGEDLGQVQPCLYDEPFFDLLRRNVAAAATNFWEAGYQTVISGSYLRHVQDWDHFRPLLGDDPVEAHIVHLTTDQPERDRRRTTRAKQTTAEWRKRVDQALPDDTTFAQPSDEYTYTVINNTSQTVEETVDAIRDLPF